MTVLALTYSVVLIQLHYQYNGQNLDTGIPYSFTFFYENPILYYNK